MSVLQAPAICSVSAKISPAVEDPDSPAEELPAFPDKNSSTEDRKNSPAALESRISAADGAWSQSVAAARRVSQIPSVLDGGNLAQIDRYGEIEGKFNRVVVLISVLSVAYLACTVDMVEASWESTEFDTDSTSTNARQSILTVISLAICAAVYWEAILFRVTAFPGLSLSFTTRPHFSPGFGLELCWNLVTSYPGTTPMLALPVCVLRVLYLFKLLRFTPKLRELRRFDQEGGNAPDHSTSSSLKLMLRKSTFPLIGFAMLLLVPLLGYLLLATQRWAVHGEDVDRRKGSNPSWQTHSDLRLQDSIWAVLFMIAIGEPYEVYSSFFDRALALLTALIAAILTTMLITALMQLIEADSATDAALKDAANKRVAGKLHTAATEFIRLQWKVHLRRESMSNTSKVQLLDKTSAHDPQARELFRELLAVKQHFRAARKRYRELNEGDEEAESMHVKMMSLLKQGDALLAWLRRLKDQLFSRLTTQDTKRQQQFNQIERRLNRMEDGLTRLLEAHAHEMREMELRMHMSEEQRDEANRKRAEKMHQEEVDTLMNIEQREQEERAAQHHEEMREIKKAEKAIRLKRF